MPSSDTHLSDEELLLAADGELTPRRQNEVDAHLAACWHCRARMAETESTIADFARAYRQTLDPQLPSVAGPRALLRAQLRAELRAKSSELAARPQAPSWRTLFQFKSSRLPYSIIGPAFLVVAMLLAAVAVRVLFRETGSGAPSPTFSASERGAVPDPKLTPGATRSVSFNEVCAMAHEEVVGEVSSSLRQQVLREYGIADPNAGDYEIDYLIAPGLGGKEDIRNLWPEPYASATWNAHVKDALEEQLHQMVCSGKVDLSTAQSDITANWIAAYKKYFRTDKPLALRSSLISYP